MHLHDHNGHRMPRIAFPGGDLLLGVGGGGSLFLQNIGDAPYRHAGKEVFLNPTLGFVEPALVEMRRQDNGAPSGMCFESGAHGPDLPQAEVEALFLDLAERLSKALADDPDLLAHVRREGAEADVRAAEEEVGKAAKALAAAGRAAIQARIRLGATNYGQPDPKAERPAFFIVGAIPDGMTGERFAPIDAEVRALARDACDRGERLPGPVMAVLQRC